MDGLDGARQYRAINNEEAPGGPGDNPTTSRHRADEAHVDEHQSSKLRAAGSRPVIRSGSAPSGARTLAWQISPRERVKGGSWDKDRRQRSSLPWYPMHGTGRRVEQRCCGARDSEPSVCDEANW